MWALQEPPQRWLEVGGNGSGWSQGLCLSKCLSVLMNVRLYFILNISIRQKGPNPVTTFSSEWMGDNRQGTWEAEHSDYFKER